MIDLHCHILPGVDDGPAKSAETLEMCRMAAKDGVSQIVATPHIRPGEDYLDMEAVGRLCEGLNQLLAKQDMSLNVLPGGEVALAPDLVARAREGSLHTLGGGGRYFCLELAEAQVGRGLEDMIFELKLLGLTPIITHPERTGAHAPDFDWIARLVELGCFSQITAMSLTGELGQAHGQGLRAYAGPEPGPSGGQRRPFALLAAAAALGRPQAANRAARRGGG